MFNKKTTEKQISIKECEVCKHLVYEYDAKKVIVEYEGTTFQESSIYYAWITTGKSVKYFCPEHAPDYDKEVARGFTSQSSRFYKKVEPWLEVFPKKRTPHNK